MFLYFHQEKHFEIDDDFGIADLYICNLQDYDHQGEKIYGKIINEIPPGHNIMIPISRQFLELHSPPHQNHIYQQTH